MTTIPTLALVGGFLGAGKTSLVLAASARLAARGQRVAYISNDQAGRLVDTVLAGAADLPTREVAGGCFCCRLSDLVSAADALRAYAPAVIFAEPVGSCIDLVATIVRPLLADHPGRFRLAPLTALVDPARARALQGPGADADLLYLFARQIDEADIVCYTKRDLGVPGPTLPGRVTLSLSARTGEGVETWLSHVLGASTAAGRRGLEVDYERYAIAEAALAWLNVQVRFELQAPASPLQVVGEIADALQAALANAGARIVHIKLLDQTASGSVRVSLVGDDLEPSADGALDASPARVHDLHVNARVLTDPPTLARCVRDALRPFASPTDVTAFAPPAPRPERRLPG